MNPPSRRAMGSPEPFGQCSPLEPEPGLPGDRAVLERLTDSGLSIAPVPDSAKVTVTIPSVEARSETDAKDVAVSTVKGMLPGEGYVVSNPEVNVEDGPRCRARDGANFGMSRCEARQLGADRGMLLTFLRPGGEANPHGVSLARFAAGASGTVQVGLRRRKHETRGFQGSVYLARLLCHARGSVADWPPRRPGRPTVSRFWLAPR